MLYSKRLSGAAAILAIAAIATIPTMASASPASNVTATNYVTETVEEAFKVKNDHIERAILVAKFSEQLKDIPFNRGMTVGGDADAVDRDILFKQAERIGR